MFRKKSYLTKLTLWLFLFCSCSDFHFKNPQPSIVHKNETLIPKNIQGTYHVDKDTLIITSNRIRSTKEKEIDLTISDSVIIRKYKNEYFLNLRESEQNTWIVYKIKPDNNNLIFYELTLKDSTVVDKLKRITKLTDMKDGTGKTKNYFLNPSPTEFQHILDQKLFTLSDTLKKIR